MLLISDLGLPTIIAYLHNEVHIPARTKTSSALAVSLQPRTHALMYGLSAFSRRHAGNNDTL